MRPCDSVAGTRCTRCTPPSYLRCAQTPCGGVGRVALDGDLHVLVAAEVALGALEELGLPALRLGVVQVHAQQVGGEQRRLSAPPSPTLISMITSRPSSGSRGISRRRSFSWRAASSSLEAGHLVGERLVLRGQLAGGREVVAQLLPGACRPRRCGSSSA